MKKTKRIEIRLTEEEYENVREKAKKEKTTISALFLNGVENTMTVNVDTSDYRELVIQVRRIGNNINNIIKRIHFSNYITDTDLMNLERNQKKIEKEIKNHHLKINQVKRELENITPKQLKNYLKEEGKRIPNYLIYDEINDQINLQLQNFIQLIEDEKLGVIFPPYIHAFIEDFHPTDYLYDELVDFSNELSDVLYKIDRMVLTGIGELTEDDFEDVLTVLDKYRKEQE